jgi:hypothetical protein
MNVLSSEWTKLRSVRSTWIAALSTVASAVALGILGASDLLGGSPSDLPAGWDPTATSLKGLLSVPTVRDIRLVRALLADHRRPGGLHGRPGERRGHPLARARHPGTGRCRDKHCQSPDAPPP